MVTFQDYDTWIKAICNDIHIGKMRQMTFTDTQSGLLTAKRHIVVVVRGEDGVYWLS